MKKIKILQFPIANSYGGITHYALENWKWMNKEQFQVDFATMSKKLDFADEITVTGSKIHYISCYAEENREQFIKEVNQILDQGYDVVHLHTKQWKSFLVEQICEERGVPRIIVHSHSTRCDANDEEKRKRETEEHYRVRKEFGERYATDFWACSWKAAEWLFGEQVPKDKIRIMNNAIETEKFLYNEKRRTELRKKYNLEGRFVIGTVGRMVYQKNHEFLLDVFSEICVEKPEAVLVLVGDGELRNEIEDQAGRLGVRDRVMMLGKRTDTNELYQMMDLFVLPSRFEGLPITLIEAQASGLKCICSAAVTDEADITGRVEYCALNKQVWGQELLKNIHTYERENMYDVIRKSGYDIQTQIKTIEKAYLQ